jgi:hypothetical protein
MPRSTKAKVYESKVYEAKSANAKSADTKSTNAKSHVLSREVPLISAIAASPDARRRSNGKINLQGHPGFDRLGPTQSNWAIKPL